MLHWLILIPYYFFAALSTSLLLIVLARLCRAKVPANAPVTCAVVIGLVAVVAPIVLGWAEIEDYRLTGFLVLGVASMVLAALDTLLQSILPLPLDRDLDSF